MRVTFIAGWVLYVCCKLWPQTCTPDGECRIGPGITPPKLLHKTEPTYTDEARAAFVQGIAVFELVIDTNGKPTQIAVISPIGFGLDERAQAAIEQWSFRPGEKDGNPVKVRANVEVSFRFPDVWYDAKAERRRTSFNVALREVKSGEPKRIEHAIRMIQDLANERYPPAMYVKAVWLRDGAFLPKDSDVSLKLFVAAAEKNYGPAMFEVGRMHLDGRDLPLDREKGLELIRDAAVLGSAAAQCRRCSRRSTPIVRVNGVPPMKTRE